jgi:hypothetical protein
MTLRPSFALLFPLALAMSASGAMLAWGTGCGNLALSPNLPDGGIGGGDSGSIEYPDGEAAPDSGTSNPIEDAGYSIHAYNGSPLCAALDSVPVCDPDAVQSPDAGPNYASCAAQALPAATVDAGNGSDDAASPQADDAGSPAFDAGFADTGAGSTPPMDSGTGADTGAPVLYGDGLACHVVPQGGDGGVAPTCLLPGAGVDGSKCMAGTDCSAGFECVGQPGSGVCRHYCCDNTCGVSASGVGDGGAKADASDTAASAPVAFCNIEPMAAYPGNAVPVCVVEPSCMLFAACPGPNGTTNANESCTIVDSQGTTACVPIGSQMVGQSCEEAPCGDGLACWGQFPNRTCQQLCDPQHLCQSGQTCTSNQVNFPAPYTAGICTTPQ